MVEALGAAAADPGPMLARLQAAGTALVTIDDDAYPWRLRAIAEPPPVLFVRGDPGSLSASGSVAIVGTRRPTEAGRRTAARIADAVARLGAVVVSGLALGIDGAAHAAVVSAERPTIAVLGSGHDRLFPKAHRRLATAVVDTGGAIVSELPPDAGPTKGTFPRRNRLISGLAEATVVVEAARGSGALITARWALEQGRGCFVVPGSIDAPASAGCLAFLREFAGEARIVAGVAELIDDLGLVQGDLPGDGRPAGQPASLEAIVATLGQSEAAVAGALVDGGTTIDALVARTGLPVSTLLEHVDDARDSRPCHVRLRPLSTDRSARSRSASFALSVDRVLGLTVIFEAAPPRSDSRTMPLTPGDEPGDCLLRKFAVAALALPVLALVYGPVLARRMLAGRVGHRDRHPGDQWNRSRRTRGAGRHPGSSAGDGRPGRASHAGREHRAAPWPARARPHVVQLGDGAGQRRRCPHGRSADGRRSELGFRRPVADGRAEDRLEGRHLLHGDDCPHGDRRDGSEAGCPGPGDLHDARRARRPDRTVDDGGQGSGPELDDVHGRL